MRDLLQLYSIESVHPNEQAISDYIVGRLKKLNASFSVSEHGIVGWSKEYTDREDLRILLSAHMDQVQTNGAPVKFYMKDDCIRGYLEDNRQTSLGADDKNGVWLILKALSDKLPFQFIISRGEECGCVGINALNIPYADVCLVLDRRGYHEILDRGCGGRYCSTLAQSLCNFLSDDWAVGSGSISDTDTISSVMESVNISTAYYKPHTAEEYTNWRQLKDLRIRICDIIGDFVHYPTSPFVYKHKLEGYKDAGLFDTGYTGIGNWKQG